METIGSVNGDESEKIRQNLNLGPKNSFLSTQQCPRVNLEKRISMTPSKGINRINNPSAGSTDDMTTLVDKLSKAGKLNWQSRSTRQTDVNTIGVWGLFNLQHNT